METAEYARGDGVATGTRVYHGQWMAPAEMYGAHGREARTSITSYAPEEVTPAPEVIGIVGKRPATQIVPSILTVINKSRGAGGNFAYWQKLPQAEKALSEILRPSRAKIHWPAGSP